MANIYWSGPKAPQKEVFTALMKEAVEYTDNTFIVCFESDDTGMHVVLKVERNEDDTSGFKKFPDVSKYMGWRLMCVHVPKGYLHVFYNADGSKNETKNQDDMEYESQK